MQGESTLQTLQLSSILFPSYSCSRDQTLGSERCVPRQLKLDISPPLALTKTSETSNIGDILCPIFNNTNSCKQEFLQQTVARNEDCALRRSLREVEICSCKLLKFTNQSPQLLFFPSCSNSFSFQPPVSVTCRQGFVPTNAQGKIQSQTGILGCLALAFALHPYVV